MSCTVFPRMYTNLQSSPTACNFNNNRTIMLFYEKWEIITEIFDSWKIQNVSIFYFLKTAPEIQKVFNILPYIQRVAISVSQSWTSWFSITYYILKFIFEIWARKDKISLIWQNLRSKMLFRANFKKKFEGLLFHCRKISDHIYWWSGKTLSVL